MQTEEDRKTSSFDSEVNADLIELDLLLDSPIRNPPFGHLSRLQPPLLRREKRRGTNAQLAKFHLQESSQV